MLGANPATSSMPLAPRLPTPTPATFSLSLADSFSPPRAIAPGKMLNAATDAPVRKNCLLVIISSVTHEEDGVQSTLFSNQGSSNPSIGTCILELFWMLNVGCWNF